MNNKRAKRLNRYYIVVIILCVLLGLFIWFLFRAIIAELDRKKDESYKNKITSSMKKVSMGFTIIKT